MPVIWSVFQTFKLFEKLADHDRERLLAELRRREENQSVPSAIQELEISDEPHKVPEEQHAEAAPADSSPLNAGDVSSQVTGPPAPATAPPAQAMAPPAQASAASKASDWWGKRLLFFSVIGSSHKLNY